MGVVFRAHDPAMARDIALKVLRLDAGLEPAQMQEIERRFEREAQAAGGLNHPNIVASYERGEIGGHKFIVMEFVEGSALHKLMSEGPRPSLQTSLNIVRQIAAGLDYAHSHGVIHRDIKPANIMLPSEGGGAKIADFGIAKATLGGSITMSSSVLGSPHYMSPEQIEGRSVTGRADQWSLAVTAYELLAGQKPFDSDSIAALFQKILSAQPRDPSELDARIPSAARNIFQRALSKSPRDSDGSLINSFDERGAGRYLKQCVDGSREVFRQSRCDDMIAAFFVRIHPLLQGRFKRIGKRTGNRFHRRQFVRLVA